MVSLTRYISVDGSRERPNVDSNSRQASRGSHKYGKVVSMRATMSFDRSVTLFSRVLEAVMDSIPMTKLSESLPASGKFASV